MSACGGKLVSKSLRGFFLGNHVGNAVPPKRGGSLTQGVTVQMGGRSLRQWRHWPAFDTPQKNPSVFACSISLANCSRRASRLSSPCSAAPSALRATAPMPSAFAATARGLLPPTCSEATHCASRGARASCPCAESTPFAPPGDTGSTGRPAQSTPGWSGFSAWRACARSPRSA